MVGEDLNKCFGWFNVRHHFFKSVDAFDKIKHDMTFFKLLEDVVLEVGLSNVVHVIIDNAIAYVAAGKPFEKGFPFVFWTPCATHCITFVLEDIGKLRWVKECVVNAKKITKFIYNYP